jgi:hypothetical protein
VKQEVTYACVLIVRSPFRHAVESGALSRLQLRHLSEEVGVVTSLAAAGWAVRGGERYRLKSPPAVRVTIAMLQPNDAARLARDFAQSLRSERHTHSA